MMSTITLGQLTDDDTGREVVVSSPGASISGVLCSIEIEEDRVDVTSMFTMPGEAPVLIPGMKTARIIIGEWQTEKLPLDTRVDVYR